MYKQLFHSKKKRVSLFMLIIMLVSTATAYALTYPPDSTLGSQLTPSVNKPAYLTHITDPTFNTDIVRISDTGVFNMSSTAIRHSYSKNAAWNSDGSKIALANTFPTPILDGNTYALQKKVSTIPTNPRWSNTNPDIMYGIKYQTNKLITWNVNSETDTLEYDFTQYTSGTLSIGDGEGNFSNDDRYVALQAKYTPSNTNYILVYDTVGNTILGTLNTGTTVANNVNMSQLGGYVAVQWGVNGTARYQGIEVFDKNLNFLRQIHTNGMAHFDLGIDTSGNEVAVYVSDVGSNHRPTMFRLSNGAATDLLGSTTGAIAPNWHISCRNTQRPGWCYYSDFAGSGSTYRGQDQVYAIKLDGSGTVERFAHSHHTYNQSAYASQPQAVPSANGEKVMFASEWGGDPLSGEVNSYVAQKLGTSSPSPTPTTTPPPSSNLVVNPGFESGSAWSIDWNNSTVVNNNPNSGTYSSRTGTLDGGRGQEITSGFAAGDTFTLKGWGKVSATGSGNNGYIGIKPINSAGADMSDNYLTFTTTSYAEKSLSFTVPAGAVKLRVYVFKPSNANYYFYADDISLIKNTVNPNLVTNAGFESGSPWAIDWSNSTVVNNNAHSGTYSSRTGTLDGGRGMEITTGFAAGDTFTLKGWGKLSATGTGYTGYIGIKPINSAGADMSDNYVTFTTTSYAEKSLSFTVPAGAVKLRVYVFKPSNANYYFYADDISLIKN